jgi:hypothetical protein
MLDSNEYMLMWRQVASKALENTYAPLCVTEYIYFVCRPEF